MFLGIDRRHRRRSRIGRVAPGYRSPVEIREKQLFAVQYP